MLTEVLDLTTPVGRAFVDFLMVCAACEQEVIRERIRAGMADVRTRGKAHGRPRVTVKDAAQRRAMARSWDPWRTSARQVLMQQEGT